MRTAAQIDKRAIGIGRDHLTVTELAQTLELERIVNEDALRIRARHLGAHERQLVGRHLSHFGLERGEVFGRERLLDLEVVVEAILDRGTKADLRFRP